MNKINVNEIYPIWYDEIIPIINEINSKIQKIKVKWQSLFINPKYPYPKLSLKFIEITTLNAKLFKENKLYHDVQKLNNIESKINEIINLKPNIVVINPLLKKQTKLDNEIPSIQPGILFETIAKIESNGKFDMNIIEANNGEDKIIRILYAKFLERKLRKEFPWSLNSNIIKILIPPDYAGMQYEDLIVYHKTKLLNPVKNFKIFLRMGYPIPISNGWWSSIFYTENEKEDDKKYIATLITPNQNVKEFKQNLMTLIQNTQYTEM